MGQGGKLGRPILIIGGSGGVARELRNMVLGARTPEQACEARARLYDVAPSGEAVHA